MFYLHLGRVMNMIMDKLCRRLSFGEAKHDYGVSKLSTV